MFTFIKNILRQIVDSVIYFKSLFIPKEKHLGKRLLIIRKDVLGDFIIFYPTLKYYREIFLEAKIYLICHTITKDLEPIISKYVDSIIWYDQDKFRTNILYRTFFLLRLKRLGFDTVIYPVFSRELMGDLMVKITKAPTRIGFNIPNIRSAWQNSSYTRLIDIPSEIKLEIDRNFFFVNALKNTNHIPIFPTILINDLPQDNAEEILKRFDLENKKYCIFFPGAGFSYRIWPVEKFAKIADYLIKKDVIPVIAGNKKEVKLAQNIIDLMEEKEKVINITGTTSLSALAYIINKSSFYFGSETGILHLAVALSKPVVCILGGGSFGRFFPYGDREKNRIVYDENMTCMGDNWACAINLKEGEIAPCIKNIEIESAKKEIDNMLYYLHYA